MARILLIEDDELVRRMLYLLLTRAGHEVVEAENGERGVALQLADPADLVLTDIIMPERDGIEALMDLRRRKLGVPVIAMSGGGRVSATDYLVAAGKLGAVATLTKPVDPKVLLETVDRALADARRGRSPDTGPATPP